MCKWRSWYKSSGKKNYSLILEDNIVFYLSLVIIYDNPLKYVEVKAFAMKIAHSATLTKQHKPNTV